MSLIIEPSDLLTFHRPLTNVTKEVLLVKNPNAEPVIFKVKTTAPKQYCVRPNAGRIDGNSQVEVQVILQPFKEEPPLDIKCKDKFLVQSAQIQPDEYGSVPVTDIWSRIEKEDQGCIRQHKIKCSFVSPPAQENNGATESHTLPDSNPPPPPHDGGSSHETKADILPPTHTDNNKDSSSTLGSASLPEEEHKPTATRNANDHVTETAKEQPNMIDLTMDDDSDDQPKEPQTATPVTASPATTQTLREVPVPLAHQVAPETTTTTTPLTGVATTDEKEQAAATRESLNDGDASDKEKLRQELVASQQQIIRLQHELEQSKQDLDGLRLRQNSTTTTTGTTGSSSSSTTRKLPPTVQPLDAVHQHLAQLQKPHPVEGYPPKVVLIMCVAVFLFTYLFL